MKQKLENLKLKQKKRIEKVGFSLILWILTKKKEAKVLQLNAVKHISNFQIEDLYFLMHLDIKTMFLI